MSAPELLIELESIKAAFNRLLAYICALEASEDKLRAENEKLKEMVARYVDIAAAQYSGKDIDFISAAKPE